MTVLGLKSTQSLTMRSKVMIILAIVFIMSASVLSRPDDQTLFAEAAEARPTRLDSEKNQVYAHY